MIHYHFPTRARSTLTGTIDATVTTFLVANATSFPTLFPFMVLLDNELMQVNDVDFIDAVRANFVVARAQENTVAAVHFNNTPVYGILTANMLNSRFSEIIQRGPIADVGYEGNDGTVFVTQPDGAGRFYQSTDSIVSFYDTGSSLVKYEGFHPLSYMLAYNWINKGSSVQSVETYPCYTNFPNDGTLTNQFRGFWEGSAGVTSRLYPVIYPITTDWYEYGIFAVDLDSMKMVTFGLRIGDPAVPFQLRADKWTNHTTNSGNYFTLQTFDEQVKYITLRRFEAGNKLKFMWGPDPHNQFVLHEVSAIDWTSNLSCMGVWCNPRPIGSTVKLLQYYTANLGFFPA